MYGRSLREERKGGNDMIFIILKSKVLVKSLYLVVIDYINI